MRRNVAMVLLLAAGIVGRYSPAAAALPGSPAWKSARHIPSPLRGGIIPGADQPGSPSIKFTHVFAPLPGRVTPYERPYREDVCLNGLWQFEPVALPKGYKIGSGPPKLPPATPGGWSKTLIRIPSPWNVDSFSAGDGGDFDCFPSYPKSWNAAQMGWLKCRFKIPASWKSKKIYLRFQAVAGDAQIIVNGRNLARHFDNFLPFEVDITHVVRSKGNNELMVGVRRADLFNITGPFRSRFTNPTGSFWGMHIAGIWQDVFLQARPALHVRNVFIQPLVDRNTLDMSVTVTNRTVNPQTFTLGAQVRPWKWLDGKNELTAPESKWTLGKTVLHVTGPRCHLAAGQTGTFTLKTAVDGRLAMWTLESPRLYGVLTVVHQGGRTVDCRYQRFGWRQWSIKGRSLLLNGRPVQLRGDAWHFMGVPEMTPRYTWAWFTMLHDAHCNAVRLHAEPYPTFFLNMADQMGIAVLDESGIWASQCGFNYDQPATWRRFKAELRAQVMRDRNHACIYGWSIANEIIPALDAVGASPTSAYWKLATGNIVKLAHMVAALDSTRPWVESNGDGDMNGRLPVYSEHYGNPRQWRHNAPIHRPFEVGEATAAYYGMPPRVARYNGDRAYESMEGRMEGLAIQAYRDAMAERQLCAYGCVFNLVWYGLKPLPLGMPDLSRPPTHKDGIFFEPYVPGRPGMQPERLGPYCTTLNPGYDPKLPLFEPWPYFLAVQAANAPGGPAPCLWDKSPISKPLPLPPSASIRQVGFIGNTGGNLYAWLRAMNIPVRARRAHRVPKLLIIDGATLSEGQVLKARRDIKAVLHLGGDVAVLDATKHETGIINRVLPETIMLTPRWADSLLASRRNPLTASIPLADLYFVQNNFHIMTHGLTGPLVQHGRVLVWACPTDWTRFCDDPENIKTAAILRSQRQKKPAGTALVEYRRGTGRLYVSTIKLTSGNGAALGLLKHLLRDMKVAVYPSKTISAGSYVRAGGGSYKIRTQPSSEGGTDACYISNGSWLQFKPHNFTGKKGIVIRVASAAQGGSIEVRLDRLNGPLAATLKVPPTGGWQNWINVAALLRGLTGRHTVFFRFSGTGKGVLLNVERFAINPASSPSSGPSVQAKQ
ncbi:MAG: carbohydrate-binding protein [Phycisphaerae bacterium]